MTRSTFRATAALLAAALALAGCGSDRDATAGARIVQGVATGLWKDRKATGEPTEVTREQLAAFNSPMIEAKVAKIGLTSYLVPYGQNAGVDTWSSAEDQTISFRDGIMIATRGFGPDIMRAVAPSAAQIAAGSGTHQRVYWYLDGADQPQRFDYQCTLANLGAETITVVDRQHSTRHVSETCTGKAAEFTNEYWFENGVFLRKSKQLLVPEWGYVTLSRVIDKG